MKRIYIFSAGVALGVAATRRTRRAKEAARAALAAKLTPSAIAADVADAIAELGNAVGSFAADVKQGAVNRRASYRPMVDAATGTVVLVPPDQVGPLLDLAQPEPADPPRPLAGRPRPPAPTAPPHRLNFPTYHPEPARRAHRAESQFMQTHEIRRRFLDHFAAAGHTVVPSASLISEDPTVLFTIAGMAPFKPYFLGQATAPFDRATSVQKCVRTLDIDNVGLTTRHNTFFQMAGNFSFGDYFKEAAIGFAWELITKSTDDGGYGFDPERIWVTVYENDDEAIELWQKVAGLPPERIQRRGGEDNYWDMGVPGPGGPCSEIYYDRGPEYGVEGGPGRRRGPIPGDLEPGLHAGRARRAEPEVRAPAVGLAAAQEHRHRAGHRAGGVPAAGRRQRLRDRPAAPDHRHRRGAVRPHATALATARTPTTCGSG